MAREFQPYVGPRPFGREDQTLFFGRNREISELLSLVIAHDLVLVYAESGAGKTSLINAGLVPRLVKEGVEVLPLGRVGGLIPEDIKTEEIPNLYVFNALMSWAKEDADPKHLLQMTLADFLRQRKHPTRKEGLRSPRVVIFDQLEELFAFYPEHRRDRREFFKQVADALEEDPLLRVVFVIREDHMAQLDPYAPLLPEKLQTRFRLERLREDAACLAVEKPLTDARRSFDESAAGSLVQELLKIRVESVTGEVVEVTGEFVEPLQLQVVCRNLWRNLPPDVTVITQDHLQAFGDVNQALSGFYEEVIKTVAEKTGVKEKDLRTWFESNLITPGGTRGMVYRGGEETGGIPNTAVDKLAEWQFIKREWRAGARWYELIHDRFIKPIQDSNDRWRAYLTRRCKRQCTIALAVIAVIVVGFGLFSLYQARRAESLVTNGVSLQDYDKAINRKYWASLWGKEKVIVKAYYKRGELFARKGDYDRAIADYDRAIELGPKCEEAYAKRGELFAGNADYDRAIADYDRAIELDPRFTSAYANKAWAIYQLGGRSDEALAVLNQAIKLDPEWAWAYYTRGLIYFGRGEYDRAIAEYDRAIKLDPRFTSAYANKAWAIYQLGGRSDEALAALNQAIKLDPDGIWAYYTRGLIYLDRGEYDRAIAEYDRVIELDPEFTSAYASKAWVLRRLIEENPKEPVNQFNLGLAYLAMGESKLAREAYREGIEKANMLPAGKVGSTCEKAIDNLEQLIAKRPDIEVEAKEMIQLLREAKEEKLEL